MIKNHIKKKILEKAVSLEKFGIRDLTWKKEDAKNLIHSLMSDDIGILGGDVYRIESTRLIPTYDNWSCEPKDGESKNDYFSRSKISSLDYIHRYTFDPIEKIVFSITFTEMID